MLRSPALNCAAILWLCGLTATIPLTKCDAAPAPPAGTDKSAAEGPAEREAKTRVLLGANTTEFRWKGVAFDDAWADWLANSGGSYFVDWRALGAAGLRRDA